ncbi:predicted protein [Naegleria gruberi]|uniref:Predicted protein n=1 Tax=Naegleria gruberi TaxID=5762 RepID=D2W3L4_NAEGR|nr:uncharacterized protein NAEGRDRAFT_54441 [Naegleria gruberi]EFC36355.1 predicted protein [Naegleria gruberi]|eukprot:XP_002669099.1 predicted protein [Naegleria gruberi strain NEG-M]
MSEKLPPPLLHQQTKAIRDGHQNNQHVGHSNSHHQHHQQQYQGTHQNNQQANLRKKKKEVAAQMNLTQNDDNNGMIVAMNNEMRIGSSNINSASVVVVNDQQQVRNYSNHHFINYEQQVSKNQSRVTTTVLVDNHFQQQQQQQQHAILPMVDNGNTLTFHTAVINKEKRKRKKKEVFEGCNHFKITNNQSSSSVDQYQDNEEIHVEKNSKKRKSGKQVQVSSFDLLSMTDNNAMFGVFKKKPTQQAYETVLNFNPGSASSSNSTNNGGDQFKTPQASSSNSQTETQTLTTPSPIHNPSSNSSSTGANISQQGTFPNPIVSNNYPVASNIGFNNILSHNSHNVNQSTTNPKESIQQQYFSSSNHVIADPSHTTLQPIIGPSFGSQPKRDLANLNYGTISRSVSFTSATDLLFSEKQIAKQDSTTGTVNNNQTTDLVSYPNNNSNSIESSELMTQSKHPIIPTPTPVQNLDKKNNSLASHSLPRTIIPSIKELFK